MKTESPPPKVRRCSPLAEKRWIRFWPYPSETKMSPLGASTAWVDTDIRDGAADCHLGPIFHHFILVIAEPDALRHGAPPAVVDAVSSRRARGSWVSIP